MTNIMSRHLAAARESIMAGKPEETLKHLDKFMSEARRNPPAGSDRDRLEVRVSELRALAEASLEGARSAAELIRSVVEAARTLQTYDDAGRRTVTNIAAPVPRRY